jgi:hypothetical protein
MSMPSRSSREHAEKPDASSDEHTSRQQSPASNPSQHSADSSRDMPIGGAGIDFQPPPSLKMPRSSPKRQVVVAKVSSPENSERRRRVDTDQRQQQQQQHRQPSSRPPAPWAIHEGQGQHPQQQQYPPYQAGAMPFSVPRSQQQVRYSLAILCDLLGLAPRFHGSIWTPKSSFANLLFACTCLVHEYCLT